MNGVTTYLFRTAIASLLICGIASIAHADNSVGSGLSPGQEVVDGPDGVIAPGSAAWDINGVESTGCNSGEYFFNTTFYDIDDPTYVHTVADADGLRYMNEQFDYIADFGAHAGPRPDDWGLFDIDHGGVFGPTTGTWPIPTGTPVTILFMLRDAFDGNLKFMREVTISQCDGGGIISSFVVRDDERATFEVNKNFDDDNDAEVEVTLSCNTGLPLEQSTTISEGDGVTFVVTDFADGEMDCTVTEGTFDGYDTEYFNGAVTSDAGCTFEDIALGSGFTCDINNSLIPVEVEVTKVWIDENPQFNAQNVAGANWSCSNLSDVCDGFSGCATSGFLEFNGNPDTDSFAVRPDWESGTVCSITEVDLFESGVEVDDSECQGLVVLPGGGASCTIFNTRFFEGIPTLSQYGLGILALLMLGMGFVAFRRVI